MKEIKVFQFTASYEADLCADRSGLLRTIFQFTASYEADPVSDPLVGSQQSFNSQPHTRLT